MPTTLSQTEVARYEAEGYHFPVRVLTAAEAASYRSCLDAFIAGAGGQKAAGPLLRHKAHLNCPPLHELTVHPKILDAVADVLGPGRPSNDRILGALCLITAMPEYQLC